METITKNNQEFYNYHRVLIAKPYNPESEKSGYMSGTRGNIRPAEDANKSLSKPVSIINQKPENLPNMVTEEGVYHSIAQNTFGYIPMFPHVNPVFRDENGNEFINSHVTIAPTLESTGNTFQATDKLNEAAFDEISTLALHFLKLNDDKVGTVMFHEADDDLVKDIDINTAKSWRQFHAHFRTEHGPGEKVQLKLTDSIPNPYGMRVLNDFQKNDVIGNYSDLKSHGYSISFKVPFPKQGKELRETIQKLDSWLRELQPKLAEKYKDKIPDDQFMSKPAYTLAIQKVDNGLKIEFKLMPHVMSQNFSLARMKGGEEISHATIENDRAQGRFSYQHPSVSPEEQENFLADNEKRMQASHDLLNQLAEIITNKTSIAA